MTTNDGHVPVTDVDQVFPVLTTQAAAPGSGGTGQDQGPLVTSVLRTVLGWRPRPEDTKAFAAALKASFRLAEVEGHVETTYVPRGVAVQADLGGISGGQASLYARARLAGQQAATLLDSLTPLRTDFDPEDCEAFRVLVRHGVDRLVEELGTLGGPRQALVDGAFDVLVGALPAGLAGHPAAITGLTADDVPGQLGALRDRFGLVDANVNTVDEEAVRTSFWTLVDLVLDLRRSWEEQKATLASGSGSGFLGTDLVIINRLMAAAAEQVDEVEAVLDSALVGSAERQTITLGHDPGLTLDGLLAWLRRFLTEDGRLYLQDTGRDGIRTAFAPLAQQLAQTVQNELVAPLGALWQPDSGDGAVVVIPASCSMPFPSGMYAARTRIAVSGLCRLMSTLFGTAAKIGRYPGVVLFDVQLTPVAGLRPETRAVAQVSVRGANLRSSYLPAFALRRRGDALRDLVLPLDDSTSASGDTVTGFFRLDDLDEVPGVRDWLELGDGHTVLVPAQSLPVAVVDGENGQVVTAPTLRVWPTYAGPPRPRGLRRRPVRPDWSDIPEGRPFETRSGGQIPPHPYDGADGRPDARIHGRGKPRHTVPRDGEGDSSGDGGFRRPPSGTVLTRPVGVLVEEVELAPASRVVEERLAEEERYGQEALLQQRIAEEERIAEAEHIARARQFAEAQRLAEAERFAGAEQIAEEEQIAEAVQIAEAERIAEEERPEAVEQDRPEFGETAVEETATEETIAAESNTSDVVVEGVTVAPPGEEETAEPAEEAPAADQETAQQTEQRAEEPAPGDGGTTEQESGVPRPRAGRNNRNRRKSTASGGADRSGSDDEAKG